MTNERRSQMLELLGRSAGQSRRVHFRPVVTLMKELSASRDELLGLVGASVTVGDFEIRVERGDQIRFERLTRPSAAQAPSSAFLPTTSAAGFDPAEVGHEAQRYADAEFAAGREISATEAVAHVLAQRTKNTTAGAHARPATKDYALAAKVLTAVIERDQRRQLY